MYSFACYGSGIALGHECLFSADSQCHSFGNKKLDFLFNYRNMHYHNSQRLWTNILFFIYLCIFFEARLRVE